MNVKMSVVKLSDIYLRSNMSKTAHEISTTYEFSEIFTEEISTESNVDLLTKFKSHSGWKSILLYQFRKQFSIIIITSIYLSCIMVLMQGAIALNMDQHNVPDVYQNPFTCK